MKMVSFNNVSLAPLVVDTIYEGGSHGNVRDDPISRMMGCGNQGGFRVVGRGKPAYVILYTSLEDPDWPDSFDVASGMFVYYGDNKKPGHLLHDTRGNRILSEAFASIHHDALRSRNVPPFFVFCKNVTSGSSRSARFLGLAVPGSPLVAPTEELVAIWKSSKGQRFQNYKAIFTILNVPSISRDWLTALRDGGDPWENAPLAWKEWISQRKYDALSAPPTRIYRSVEEQLPKTPLEQAMLYTIYEYFKDRPHAFEACAATVAGLENSRIRIEQMTRFSVDGGHDALGHMLLGLDNDPVKVSFALEAKCYRPDGYSGATGIRVGVKEVARLVSRLRHRQFGILVTTSAISRQAYQEMREDTHPIVVFSGGDIIRILRSKGYGDIEAIQRWLASNFPK